MKIAVIFSTQLRTIKYTTPNLLKFFGELFPQIDFFCHTWDISYHSTKQSGCHHLWGGRTELKGESSGT
jgi:hypothetical protein